MEDFIVIYFLIGIVVSAITDILFYRYPMDGVKIGVVEVLLITTLWPYFAYQFFKGMFSGDGDDGVHKIDI